MKRFLVFVPMISICAGLLLIFCAPAIAGDKADKEALIDCTNGTFNSLEANKDHNEVHPGFRLTWYAYGKKDTKVTITFVKKDQTCKAESPFQAPSFEDTLRKDYGFLKIDSGKVKDSSADACYGYKITCTPPPPGSEKVIDPIIDVPR